MDETHWMWPHIQYVSKQSIDNAHDGLKIVRVSHVPMHFSSFELSEKKKTKREKRGKCIQLSLHIA